MSDSTAGRICMAPVSRQLPVRCIVTARLRPERHLGGIAGEGAVVGERGRVVAGVALVGAGAARVLVGAADPGDVDDRRLGVLEEVGEAWAEAVEGGFDAPDAAIGALDARGAEV